MAKFVFTLEPVLAQRVREERERQREVAHLERQRVELDRSLANAEAVSKREEGDLRARLQGGRLDLRGARVQGIAIARASGEARLAALRLAGVMQQLEQARGLLAQAAAKRRAVELLKEQQYESWKRERARVEQNALDEVAARGAGGAP